MNPYVVQILAVDALALVAAGMVWQLSGRPRLPNLGPAVAAQLLALLLAFITPVLEDPVRSAVIWAFFAATNIALSWPALVTASARPWGHIGLAGTALSLFLVILRTFLSWPILFVSSAICLASLMVVAHRGISSTASRQLTARVGSP